MAVSITTGIFRSWFSYEDPQGAIYLSSILLLFVFAALLFEKYQRGSARYQSQIPADRPLSKTKPQGLSKIVVLLLCAIPASLGFILPVLQLIWWAVESYGSIGYQNLGTMIVNSFSLALVAALICVVIATLLLFATRVRKSSWLTSVVRLSTMGYAIPGAVVAVGVLIPLLFIDKLWLSAVAQWGYSHSGLLLTGTVIGLLFAYAVRFMAVAYNPIESGYTRIGAGLQEAALTLGTKPSRILRLVDLPLLKGALLSAALLVFIDVLKELPLTLILRPFNFNTLATRSFELASDELVAAAAVPQFDRDPNRGDTCSTFKPIDLQR